MTFSLFRLFRDCAQNDKNKCRSKCADTGFRNCARNDRGLLRSGQTSKEQNASILIQLQDPGFHSSESLNNQGLCESKSSAFKSNRPIVNKRWSQKQKKIMCDSRWNLTAALADKIVKSDSPPQVFISGSAIGIYGRQPADINIDESFVHMHDEFSHQLCAHWEELALQASEKSRTILLRTGIVLARHQGILKKMVLPFSLGMGAVLGNGKQMMSWIHLDDIVAAIVFLLKKHSCHGAFNITAPNPVSNKTFTRQLAAQLHRPAWLTMPNCIQRILFGEMADLFMYGQNVRPTKLLKAGFSFEYPSLTQALSAIYS